MATIGSTVYAAEYFTGTVGIVELAARGHPDSRSVKLGGDAPLTAERRGEMLFHDAQYCLEKWLSCSSCHPSDGRPDGLNWDLMLDGVGNAKNTKSLLFVAPDAAHHGEPAPVPTPKPPCAPASATSNLRSVPEEDAVAVDAYLKSLRPTPSPYLENGRLSAAGERGSKVFEKAGCASCHAGRLYTDMRKHDVGTGRGLEKGWRMTFPTLVEVWRTAPYQHDGRAPTLKHLFHSPESGPVHHLIDA